MEAGVQRSVFLYVKFTP